MTSDPKDAIDPRAPIDDETAVARLRAADVPAAVIDVARRLQDAGYEAVLVGGAVRDVLLGLPANDWDLASSATPEEVLGLFRRTIPTGVQHGTVTVLARQQDETYPVEVTTFRGEGEYVDGRRPESVVFLRDLVEDLARRDFTVNAFAWDPVAGRFSDPFGGREDLRAGIVRAVGDARERFLEDGLRTMRAVRFCATRDLRLEPSTEAAIGDALHVLAKVSRERVRVELYKLLGSPQPSRGLVPMHRSGIWPLVVLPLADEETYARTIEAVDAMAADPVARVARLLWPVALGGDASDAIVECVEKLKPSRAERAAVLALTGQGSQALASATTPAEIRRAVSAMGREYLEAALEVHGADEARRVAVRAATEGVALRSAELSIKGRDLIAAGVVQKGPAVGRVLAGLLDLVLEDPTLDEPEGLMTRARELAQS